MKFPWATIAFLALSPAALAQDLQEIPDSEPMPPGMLESLSLDLGEDELIDTVRRWEGDLAGDAMPDQLVQLTVGFRGGNAYYFRHWIFIAEGTGFPRMFPLDLGGGLSAVRIEGNDLVATSFAYRDGDARCCPSGLLETRIPLR